MSFHGKRKILYIKAETTAGTYVTSTLLFAGANAIIPMSDIKFSPTVDITERNPDGPSLQAIEGVHGTQQGKLTFSTAFYTSGAAGTAPTGLSDLMKACFQSETTSAGVSNTYASDPNSQVRLSMGWGVLKEDGTAEVQHAIAGAAGTYKMKADKVGNIVMVEWEFTGKIAWESAAPVAVDDATPQTTITYADEVANRLKFMAVTGTGLFAAGLNVGGFEFDRGVSVEMETDITDPSGFSYAKFMTDAPTVSCAPVMTPIATKNHLSELVAGGVSSNSLTVGSAAGKRMVITWPKLETVGLTDETRGVTQTWGVKANARRTNTGTASDAYSIALT